MRVILIAGFAFLFLTVSAKMQPTVAGETQSAKLVEIQSERLRTMKTINKTIRRWHMQLKNASTLADLSKMFNLVLKGWYNYYGRFYPSAMSMIWRNLNWYLVQWVRRKYKRFAGHKKRAREYLNV